MVILVFFIELIFTFDGQGPVTIYSEYSLKDETIIFVRGFLLDNFDEYHELVYPFELKKEVKIFLFYFNKWILLLFFINMGLLV